MKCFNAESADKYLNVADLKSKNCMKCKTSLKISGNAESLVVIPISCNDLLTLRYVKGQ